MDEPLAGMAKELRGCVGRAPREMSRRAVPPAMEKPRFPESNRGNGATVIALKQRLVGDVEPILWTLFGAVGFVFAIACVNVSNLLLALKHE